jgi:hypothetical protein
MAIILNGNKITATQFATVATVTHGRRAVGAWYALYPVLYGALTNREMSAIDSALCKVFDTMNAAGCWLGLPGEDIKSQLPSDWRCPTCKTPTAKIDWSLEIVRCKNGHESQ